MRSVFKQNSPILENEYWITDLNFGMHARDAEIRNDIALMKERYSYPQYIDATIGKNLKNRVVSNY